MKLAMRAVRSLALAVALATVSVTAAACGSLPSDAPEPLWGDVWAGVPGAARMADLHLANDVRDLALTVYPVPRRTEYGEVLLPLDGALRTDEASEDVDAALRATGLELGFREVSAEGYVLAVTWENGHTQVLAAAHDDAGRAWAAAALAQISTVVDGRRVVRACRVLDAPIFALRGNKRPEAWELAYRANFAWEAKARPEFEGRELVATYAPGSPLDATQPASDRILAKWREWQARGVRRFCLKFDDVGFEMTVDTETRFGSYAASVVSLVGRLRDGLRQRDPDAILYYLPQTYWWNDRRLTLFARALADAGGLPPDIGLVVTGPEIISDDIDASGLVAARGLFGTSETPSLIYDNLGREGDWGPLTGRDPALSVICEGVFGERGTPVNRLTRLDWLWNPEAYDPEWSWRRAIFALAGPDGFAALRDACAAFRRGASRDEAMALVETFAAGGTAAGGSAAAGPDPVPRDRLASLLRGDVPRLPGPVSSLR